jgi:hypothetical protein
MCGKWVPILSILVLCPLPERARVVKGGLCGFCRLGVLVFLLGAQSLCAVRASGLLWHRFVLDCSLRCCWRLAFFDSLQCYDFICEVCSVVLFYVRSRATVPLPVPSWTPADRRLRPRSGAIRPTPIISVRSSCGTPRRSIIRNTPGLRARSRGHVELAGSRRDSRAVKRRINTVTKVDLLSPSWGRGWYTWST